MSRFGDLVKTRLAGRPISPSSVVLRARPAPRALNCRLTADQMIANKFVPVEVPAVHAFDVRGERRLLAHLDFIEWMQSHATDKKQIKRARVVAMQILTRGFASQNKGVRGKSAGWQRAGLGGTSGSHDYLWYAQGGTALGESLGLAEHEVLLRMVRFHDDTDRDVPATSREDLLDFTPEDILWPGNETSENPFTDEQNRAALVHTAPIRTIRGFPGAGKTTTLQMAASSGRYRHLLYLTFNKRLADDARTYFDYFTPHESLVEVMSFEAFLEQIADENDGAVKLSPPALAAETLAAKLTRNRADGFGPWEGHIDELYADLHAYAVGSALPFSFRGLAAESSYSVPREDYIAARREHLGSAVESAGRFLDEISDAQLLFELFPGPCLSRSLLADVEQPAPPGFEQFDSIFVDEVQDLTLVELALVFNIAARIAVMTGRMPEITVAGDESQTVRPTDFGWSDLHALAREFFPGVGFDDCTLTSNLRSPLRIASIVEASSNQYELFDRADRPRGQAQTLIDHDFPGQVTYCEKPFSSTLASLVGLVGQLPRTCLVYPGSRLPEDVLEADDQGLVATADEVKGLDYETTIVLDAGERQSVLRDRLTKDNQGLSVVWGRTLADQYRVCVSRATNKLVLLDRAEALETVGLAGKGLEPIRTLLKDGEAPSAVDYDDLEGELRGTIDHIEVIRGISEELTQLLATNPERALRRAEAGRRRLEEARIVGVVPDDVVRGFERSAGIVLVTVALVGNSSHASRHLLERANEHFTKAGTEEAFQRFSRVLEVVGDENARPDAVATVFIELPEIRAELKRSIPELIEWFDRRIFQWLGATLKRGPRSESRGFQTTVGNARIATMVLLDPFPHVQAALETGLLSWGETLIVAGRFADALVSLEGLTGVDAKRGTCLEAQGQYEEAFVSYVAAKCVQDAVRVSRRAGNLKRAREIDDGSDPSVSQSMEWLNRVLTAVESSSPDLLVEERELLSRSLADRISEFDQRRF